MFTILKYFVLNLKQNFAKWNEVDETFDTMISNNC